MTLESNISAVIYRMQRRRRDVESALRRALQPSEWESQARLEAKATLWALAKQEEWRMVDPFLDTMMTVVLPGGDPGFFLRMNNPLPPVLSVDDFAMAAGLQSAGGPNLFSDFANQFDQLMADWVANVKDKDKRDSSKTDEDIGHWIGYLMLTPDSKLSDQPSDPGRISEREAKRRLLPHIVKYIEQRQQSQRLSSETINTWLQAVLAAWEAMVRREFAGKLQRHLAAVTSEL
ncbi:MAG: hypothetical protein ABSE16_01510 [Verrucomicrobiota bacterium]